MQILLASAKIMNGETAVSVPLSTNPLFIDDARRFAGELSQWSVEEIGAAMGCNAQIAAENKLRYARFMEPESTLPAVLAYYGQAYKYLRAQEFSAADFRFAQRHLLITSFIYGLLRPLDSIHPYRLEGKVRLSSTGDRTMFDYWRERLTDVLIGAVQSDDGVLVYLAAEEMKRLFDWRRVEREVTVVQPLFYADDGTRLKAVVVHAKSCRGAMAGMVIRERLRSVRPLRAFELDGYRWQGMDDDGRKMVFVKHL